MAIKFSVLVSKLARLGFLGHWITQVGQEKYMIKDTKHDMYFIIKTGQIYPI